ncbi:CBS domain-containing protein [Bdellovibrionota bacterium FG-2]
MIELNTIGDIMTKQVFTVGPTSTVQETVVAMVEAQAAAAVVLDPESGKILGIFTERDLVRRVIGKDLDPKTTQITDAMTPDPVCCKPSEEIKKVAMLMVDRKFRNLPIKDGNNLVGMVSVLDMLKYLAEIYQHSVFSSQFI